MADPDFIRSMRGDPKPVRQSGLLDIVLGAVALVAVAAAGYFGVTWWTGQNATSTSVTASAPAVVVASLGPGEGWTEGDTKQCERAAAAADRQKVTDALLARRSITDGFPYFATLVSCKITTKAERFCDPNERAAMVAMVNDYVSKVGLIIAALNLEGAPMNMMAGMNGEIGFGAEVHNMMRDETIDFMTVYHKKIGDGVRELVRDGIVTESDFGAFMGMGVAPMIKEMLKDVEATGRRCG